MNAVLSPMGMNFFPEPEINHKVLITKRLSQTGREGMDELLSYMEDSGFFSAPCSGGHHLCVEGGLATHSWNVYQTALKLNETLGADIPEDTLAVCSLLHDLGKTGDFGKEMYVQSVLKTGKVSVSKPYKRNPTLSIRSSRNPIRQDSSAFHIPVRRRGVGYPLSRRTVRLYEV